MPRVRLRTASQLLPLGSSFTCRTRILTTAPHRINAATGGLTQIVGSPFASANDPYRLAVDPRGKFLYVPNDLSRGSVSAFTINQSTGKLTKIAGSPFRAAAGPQGLAIDPGDKFLYDANTSGTTVSAYKINPSTGALSAVTGSPFSVGTDPAAVAVAKPY